MPRLTGLLSGQSRSSAFVCRACLDRLSVPIRRQSSIAAGAFRKTLAASFPSRQGQAPWQSCRSRNFTFTAASLSKNQPARTLLPSGPARTRFAPSPTGYLHLGSLRTALFNYLLAKRTGGQFLLRIEDTDQKRLVSDAEQRLCDDLRWAGIQWDEGPQVGGPFGPYKQSERTELYQKHAHQLLDSNQAYRCFCSTAPPAPVQADASLVGTSIGGCQSDCASLSSEKSAEKAKSDRFAIRMGRPSKAPSWSDLVYGKVSLESKKALPQRAAVEGVILLKGDGTPTYHLANVVDDHHMEITHVIRGTEWMSSTPLHVALYNAFGWTPPAFAHVGLLTDKDQAKLSKRNFDTDISALKSKHGILSDSLVNFLALLGWRNPTRDDVMELDRLIELFDLKFTKGNSIVSFEKLWYLQKHHAKRIIERGAKSSTQDAAFEDLVKLVATAAQKAYAPDQLQMILGSRDLETLTRLVLYVDDKNYENPSSYIQRNAYFFTTLPAAEHSTEPGTPIHDLHSASLEIMALPAVKAILEPASSMHSRDLKTWLDTSAKTYSEAIEEVCRKRVGGIEDAEQQLKELRKGIHRYLREKLCSGLPGPSSSNVMAVLGRDECSRRLEA